MLHVKSTWLAKATSDAAARSGATCPVFTANAMLMEPSGGNASATATNKEFSVVNVIETAIKTNDIIVVGETDQGAFITMRHSPCRAKWIQFRYSSGAASPVTPDYYFDGPNPSLCGDVNVDYPLGEPCMDDVDVIAFYDSNTDTYQAISTRSAMLGDPETKTVVLADISIADTCLLTYNKQSFKMFPCGSAPEQYQVSIGTTAVDVVTAVYDNGTAIAVEYTTVYVCGFGGGYDGAIPTEICVDPPPECTGSCTWTWRFTGEPNNGYWELTTPCPYGCNCGEQPLPPTNANDPESDGLTSVSSCVSNT